MIRLNILEWSLLIVIIIMLSITQAVWYNESYSVEAWGKGGTYTEATLGKINTLNPLFATTNSEKTLSKLMFATLSAPDYSGHTGLALASSITVDDEGEVWTVKLRDNLKWSDGEPITNEDVLYTVKTIQSSTVNSNYSSYLSKVKVSEEEGNIIFTLPTAYANFSSALDFPILPSHILKDTPPAQLLEHSFSTTPVTSGAFNYNAVQNVGTQGEKIIYLTANSGYYGGKPLLDSFSIHAYLTTDEIIDAMNAGSVTATAELLSTDDEKITNSEIQQKQTSLSSGVYAFFNTKQGIFSNKALRKAVQKGLDTTSLRAPLKDEDGMVFLDYPLTTNQIAIKKYPELPEYDPDSAKEAIAKAGLSEDTKLRLATANTGYFPDLAENMKYQLEQLGFKVELNMFTPGQESLTSVIRPRNYDVLIYEIELGADPDLFAYYHSSQANQNGLNLSNYANATASDVLLAARSATDQELRAAKYETFLEQWVEDAPAIGIYQVNMSYYVNKNTLSFSEDNRLVTPLDRFTDIQFWSTEKVKKNRTP